MSKATDTLDQILIAVEKRGAFNLDTQDKLPISETMSVNEAKAALLKWRDEEVVAEVQHHINKAQSNLRREFQLNRSERYGMDLLSDEIRKQLEGAE